VPPSPFFLFSTETGRKQPKSSHFGFHAWCCPSAAIMKDHTSTRGLRVCRRTHGTPYAEQISGNWLLNRRQARCLQHPAGIDDNISMSVQWPEWHIRRLFKAFGEPPWKGGDKDRPLTAIRHAKQAAAAFVKLAAKAPYARYQTHGQDTAPCRSAGTDGPQG